ncbi:MAG TPA: hypothetical protein VIQ79_13250 [Kribbella sp.]|jgi:hypothetical protein
MSRRRGQPPVLPSSCAMISSEAAQAALYSARKAFNEVIPTA